MEKLISEKMAQVLDLLEQIEATNKMIKTHEGDSFMEEQYQLRKNQFVSRLAESLREFDIHPQDLAA
ncbi:MAG: hypothetical protein AAFQ87_06405 [Bacteroidota bacterium]